MKIVVDRIESDYIVAELPDGKCENLPLCFAPDAKEGDIINICIDQKQTQQVTEKMQERLNRLFDK